MAKMYNLGQLREEVSLLLNFNEAQIDPDFSANQVNFAINQSYNDEVEAALEETDRDWFKMNQELSWPKGKKDLTLPETISGKNIVRVSSKNLGGQFLFLKDSQTLGWKSSSGPSADKKITVTYIAEPEELRHDSDEPTLIPRRFRHLIAWSAAILLRQVADEVAPAQWMTHRRELRMRMWSAMSQGRPMESSTPAIKRHNQQEKEHGFEIEEEIE